MLVDCDGCTMRDVACMECAVGVLLGLPEARRPADASSAAQGNATVRDQTAGSELETGPVTAADGPDGGAAADAFGVVEQWPGRRPFEWDATERRAIKALIDGGLIPPIRPVRSADAVTKGKNPSAERGRLAG